MSTVNINVVDKSVAPLNPVNIAIINQKNPVSGYPVNGDQMLQLIQFPQYWITDAATGIVINGGNIYEYFPELRPGGGGSNTTYTIASYTDGSTGEVTYRLMESLDGDIPVAVGDVITFRGNEMLVTYGTQLMILDNALDDIKEHMDATYNFTTFNELGIDTHNKTLKQITDELHTLDLDTNTVVSGQLYSTALPFSGNGEAEVIVNKPAYWWKCTSLNVAPYSWNAIAGGGSWSGVIMDWTPTYVKDADQVDYDNTTSELSAADVQGAIDELASDKLDVAPDGTTNLIDSSGVVDPTYLPDYLLGACIYAGNVTTNAVATLTTAAQHKLGTTSQSITLTNDTTAITGYAANEGLYYIATADFSFASLTIKTGDWLISTGTKWGKVDTTDEVTGVKGDAEDTYRIGNVNITKTNIGLGNVDNTSDLDKPISTATQNALNLKANTADLAAVATSGSYSDLSNTPTIDTELSTTSTNAVQNRVITNTIGDVNLVLESVLHRAGGHVVKITTLAGATVTLTNQSNTYNAVADSNGLAEFTGVEAGTYTVYATIDDAVSDSISIVIADHTATEDSFATLTVSASDNTTITATDGTVTKTIEYTGTPVVQYVSLGTWDLSCVIDEETVTEQVTVSDYENTNVHLEPPPPPPVPGEAVTRTTDFVNNTTSLDGDVSQLLVYSNMKRCNVADDGTINAYDGDAGYTEDGSNGQVMVYVRKFYYKLDVSEEGSLSGVNIRKGKWSISDTPDTGFKLHPAFIGTDGTTELDYFLYGAFEAVGQDNNGTYSTNYNTTSYKMGSVGGNAYEPIGNLERYTARTMAANRGTGWYQAAIRQTMAVQMLFAVEYGFNSQLTLGQGFTDSSNSNPINAGTTTGSISSGSTTNAKIAVNYRGIENMWGNKWVWIDGLNMSSRTPYICNSYSFADNTTTGYTQIAFNCPSSNNYQSALGYDSTNDWVLLPSEASGANQNSAIGDYVYTSTGNLAALLGGLWSDSSDAGLFYWYLAYAASARYRYVGVRLMYIPS